MAIFGNKKVSKIENIQPAVAHWNYALTMQCPICHTRFDLTPDDLKRLKIGKRFKTTLPRNPIIPCPFCDLPILVGKIHDKPIYRDSNMDEDDFEGLELPDEGEETMELDFDRGRGRERREDQYDGYDPHSDEDDYDYMYGG